MASTIFALLAFGLLMVTSTSSLHVDSCEKEKDCSLKVGDNYLNCTVGHKAECDLAKSLLQKTGVLDYDLSFLPHLSSLEIYDRHYLSRFIESLKFQFKLPTADIGDSGQVQGVLVEFSEKETANRNFYYRRPICRYFNFSGSVITKGEVSSRQMKISYNCSAVDIIPSMFVLKLQTVPASRPLVYLISWEEDTEYMFDDSAESVWTHRLIAVADLGPSRSQSGHVTLHVIFQPADTGVKYYDVTLLNLINDHTTHKEVQNKFLEANKPAEGIKFQNVKPGTYKVKVEALGYVCEIYPSRCPPLISSVVTLETQEATQSPTDHNPKTGFNNDGSDVAIHVEATEPTGQRSSSPPDRSDLSLLAALGLLTVLVLVLSVLGIWYACVKHRSKKNLSTTETNRVIINVTSLASVEEENQISRLFAKYLTETMNAEVRMSLPYASQEDADFQICVTPTGSDDPLLDGPKWTTSVNKEGTPVDSALVSIVLDFFYGDHEYQSLTSPPETSTSSYPTKSLPRLRYELRRAIETCGTTDRVLCVTFLHQMGAAASTVFSLDSSPYGQSDALSSRLGGRSGTAHSEISLSIAPRAANDTMSLVNKLISEDGQTGICGVLQFFLPADRDNLYLDLLHRTKPSSGLEPLLDSDYSKSMSNALELFERVRERRSYIENYVNSQSCWSSMETLGYNMFLGPNGEANNPH